MGDVDGAVVAHVDEVISENNGFHEVVGDKKEEDDK